MSMDNEAFVPEAWIWLSITIIIIVARYVSRFIQLKSIWKMTWEDLVMSIVACLYVTEIAFLLRITFTPTNLIPPDVHLDLNDKADVALRIYGSKLIVAQETNFCALIWGTKACLLLYYAKLTDRLPGSYRWTKITAAYVALGYVVMVILYFSLWCQPFYEYWSVPVTNSQCATAQHHLILNFVLNVSSDFMIMAIPIPLLIRSQLPLRKKLALLVAFSLGSFVITSAVLNRYYSFTNPTGNGWVYWFAREASTAVIVANSPHLWALIRRVCKTDSIAGHTPQDNSFQSGPARFYDDVQNPLSPRRPAWKDSNDSSSRSVDTYDIEKVLADVERECHMTNSHAVTSCSRDSSPHATDVNGHTESARPSDSSNLHKELPPIPSNHTS